MTKADRIFSETQFQIDLCDEQNIDPIPLTIAFNILTHFFGEADRTFDYELEDGYLSYEIRPTSITITNSQTKEKLGKIVLR